MNITSNYDGSLPYDNSSLLYVTKLDDQSKYHICYIVPPHTVSDGLWGNPENGRTPMNSFFPVFQLQVLVIFSITQVVRFILKPLGLPILISQMMAGLLIGTAFHVEALLPYVKMVFPLGSHDVISTISSIGFAMFVFITGVQMDVGMITRTGNKAWAISIVGLVAPVVVGLAPPFLFPDKLESIENGLDLYIAMVSHVFCSFAVISTLLGELQIQNSELGRLALSSALVSDLLGMFGVTIAATIAFNAKMVLLSMFELSTFVILIPLVTRPVMIWIIKHTPEGRPVKDGYIHIIITVMFVLGIISTKIAQEFILGSFILGLSVPEGPPLGSALVKKLQFFGTSFFLPIFVTTSVMKADYSMDYSTMSVLNILFVILVTHLVKITAYFLSALYCNLPTSDAFSLAFILNTKGVVEIGFYNTLYDSHIINGQVYGMLLISVMITASLMQWSVKLLHDPTRKYVGYQKRNIMSLKPNSELKILAIIHKHNHISQITDFLDLCCPTTDNPITVEVLHLVELLGRALPVFMPHSLQSQVPGSHKSYSDDIIVAFDMYEHENQSTVASVSTYTAISPPDLMYEDVCNLALDKVASIIVLPFHQRWSSDGRVESDDKKIRALNRKVLEIAPCSVGILVSRASLKGTTSSTPHTSAISVTRLAVIYLGGEDDKEVLCIAKRAIKNPGISLVVYHLVGKEQVPELEELMENDGDDIMEQLQEMKQHKNVRYQEISIYGGSETVSFLRGIVNEHDFFIVGRRHGIESAQTEGLTRWSEFPELGVIGDFLSSPDLKSHAYVMVVQQQLSRKTRTAWLL